MVTPVPSGSQPSPGPLARAISAQIRVLMAEQNLTAVALAKKSGLSRSYLGKRLRDEASLTSNDIEALIDALGVDIITFANDAVRRIRKQP
jgi:transcriptional regulator with XRE-family HTH domain